MLIGVTGLVSITGILAINQGDVVFRVFHLYLFFAIWIVVPFMVADSLSQERREGTLGLLFLTPLRPIHIVVAKSMAHALRGLCFLAASTPVIVITVLLGGVNWPEVGLSMTFIAAAFCWSLGAGLLGSSQCKVMRQSLAASTVWAIVGFSIMTLMMGSVLYYQTPLGEWVRQYRGNYLNWARMWEVGISWCLDPTIVLRDRPSRFAGGAPVASQLLLLIKVCALILGTSLVALWACICLAARNIEKRWQEEPPSAARQKLQVTLCRPRVATGLYRRWLERMLNRNPMGWLDQRTWQARIIMWTWLAALVSVYCWILTNGTSYIRGFDSWQRALSLLLLMTIAAASAGSFHRERESGVLELLLVSPLSIRSILWGRLLGLWGQFMPAVLLLVIVWVYMTFAVGDIFLHHRPIYFEFYRCATLVLGFLCIPMVGLFYSLRMKHFLSAFIWTLLTGLVIPITSAMAGLSLSKDLRLPNRYGNVGDESTYTLITTIYPALILVGISGAMILGLASHLRNRRFVVNQ